MYTEDELRALNEMSGIVYTITNLVSGRVVYVGKTVRTFNERYGGCDKLGYVGAERVKYATHSNLLIKELDKYGVENFKVNIVYDVSQDEHKLPKRKNRNEKIDELLLLKEAEFVYKHKTFWTNGGCNVDCDDMFYMMFCSIRNKRKKEEILKEWINYTIEKHKLKYGHIHYIFDDLKLQNKKWNELKKQHDDVAIMLLKNGYKLNIEYCNI